MNPPQQSQHPKVLINIILINSNVTKILFVKKRNQSYWELLGHVLEYGETFNQRIKEIMSETTYELGENIDDKVKFLCSFNAVDVEKQRHFVELMYVIKLEEGNMAYVDQNRFKFWKWMTMEDIKKESLFFGFEIFLNKYKIKEIKDILLIHSI
jgi:ADP-ribose pyrophosphatase YjhB (NUDIX family)